MPSREPNLSLHDISEAIAMIEQFTLGMDFEAYREDFKTMAAVERKLLLISEAAARLRRTGSGAVSRVAVGKHPRYRQLAAASV